MSPFSLVAGVQYHDAPFGLQTRRNSWSSRRAYALHWARSCSISALWRRWSRETPHSGGPLSLVPTNPLVSRLRPFAEQAKMHGSVLSSTARKSRSVSPLLLLCGDHPEPVCPQGVLGQYLSCICVTLVRGLERRISRRSQLLSSSSGIGASSASSSVPSLRSNNWPTSSNSLPMLPKSELG
jgi:hypothetical protein